MVGRTRGKWMWEWRWREGGEGGYAHVLWCHSCSSTPRIVSLIPPNRFFRLNKLFAPSKAADFFPNTSQSERTTTTTITAIHRRHIPNQKLFLRLKPRIIRKCLFFAWPPFLSLSLSSSRLFLLLFLYRTINALTFWTKRRKGGSERMQMTFH